MNDSRKYSTNRVTAATGKSIGMAAPKVIVMKVTLSMEEYL